MVKRTVPAQRLDACMVVEDGRTHCIDPLEPEISVLSRRWALLVIAVVGNAERVRFNAAKRTIPGITARALADVLRVLQDRNLVARDVDTEASPPAVWYRLTPRGRGLRKALVPLLAWAATDDAAIGGH